MSREIRWGVISTGTIARNFVRTAAAIPVFGAIYGTKGRIEIPEFKNPQRAMLFVDGEACLRAGLTHSTRITPQQSVAVMALMDKARRQNGLVFPFEAA